MANTYNDIHAKAKNAPRVQEVFIEVISRQSQDKAKVWDGENST